MYAYVYVCIFVCVHVFVRACIRVSTGVSVSARVFSRCSVCVRRGVGVGVHAVNVTAIITKYTVVMLTGCSAFIAI